jgi:hypothetical protein
MSAQDERECPVSRLRRIEQPLNWNWLGFLIAHLPFDMQDCFVGVSA